MALSPIQLFQSNQNSLAQILAGGNQTVSGIMDKAIQIGRDISNKQLSQEKDLIGMRVQQQAFDQRRAETAQQDYEDQQRFARGAFESDRRYGLEMKQEERAGVRDLFNMQTEQERIGLAREGLGLSKSRFELEKSEDERKRAELEAERARVNSLLTPSVTAGEAAPEETRGPVETIARTVIGATPLGGLALGAFDALRPKDAAPATKDAAPKMSREDAAVLLGRSEAVLSSKLSSQEARDEAARTQARIAELFPEGAKEETPAGRRSARSLEIREETLARQKEEDEARLLVGDTKAFTPQVPQVYKEGATKKDLEEAKSFDADRFASEINSAQNYSEEAYVNFKGMTLTQSQKDKRRKLWQYADRLKRGTSTSSPAAGGSAVDSIPGI